MSIVTKCMTHCTSICLTRKHTCFQPSLLNLRDLCRYGTCFLGQAADSFYEHCTNRAITPGYGYARIPVLADHTLALPESFDDIDTSNVRCIVSMEHAASVLRRYEGVIRREMASSSEVDQFFDIPES